MPLCGNLIDARYPPKCGDLIGASNLPLSMLTKSFFFFLNYSKTPDNEKNTPICKPTVQTPLKSWHVL